ncbi:MAG: hypothetical protein ABSB00_03550 [Minisyncoccia bacterium]|jgi:hypothetical protein
MMIVGCGAPNLPDPTGELIVGVRRCTGYFRGQDPGIKLTCKSAAFDYDGRKIILEGIGQFGSYYGNDWIGNISIEGNKLILKVPRDAEYKVYIGEQKHILSKIINK